MLNTHPPHDPAIPLLGFIQENENMFTQTCT